MAYTDKFFTFPIRIYDPESIIDIQMEREQAMREGAAPDEIPKMRPNWIVAKQKCLPEDIIAYSETFSEDKNDFEAIERDGFPSCLVYLDGMNDTFMCTWPLKKFEEKLNEFVEKRQSL